MRSTQSSLKENFTAQRGIWKAPDRSLYYLMTQCPGMSAGASSEPSATLLSNTSPHFHSSPWVMTANNLERTPPHFTLNWKVNKWSLRKVESHTAGKRARIQTGIYSATLAVSVLGAGQQKWDRTGCQEAVQALPRAFRLHWTSIMESGILRPDFRKQSPTLGRREERSKSKIFETLLLLRRLHRTPRPHLGFT